MSLAALKSLVLAVGLSLISAMAVAQPDARTEARAHFERGLALANGQAYAEAVAELNRAYELSHDAAVLFHLGRAYVGMGHPIYAVEAFSRYLSEGGQQVLPAQRKQVEAEIAQQERLFATVTIRSPFPGATLWLDSVVIGKSPLPTPLRVTAGAHVVAASLAGYRPWTQRLALAGREQKIVDIAFEPLPASAPAATASPSGTSPAAGVVAQAPLAPTSANPPSAPPGATAAAPATDASATVVSSSGSGGAGSRRLAAYVVGGLGIGSLVVGSVFGVRAISKENESGDLCPNDRCSQRGVDLHNQAKTSALVSDLTIGAGLVGVAIATYLIIRTPKSAEATPAPMASGIHLTPELGPGFAGLALGGSL